MKYKNLKYKCGFIAANEQREAGWLGVIFDDSPNEQGKKTVLTVGMEDTEFEIIQWCEGSIQSMNEGGEELPDRAER